MASTLCPYIQSTITKSDGSISCKYGERCPYQHGDLCDICGIFCLHPTDQNQRKTHEKVWMHHFFALFNDEIVVQELFTVPVENLVCCDSASPIFTAIFVRCQSSTLNFTKMLHYVAIRWNVLKQRNLRKELEKLKKFIIKIIFH